MNNSPGNEIHLIDSSDKSNAYNKTNPMIIPIVLPIKKPDVFVK